MGASSLIVLIIAAVAFSGIAIMLSTFVLKASTNKQKGEPYECGIPTKGKTWIQLNVGYYLFALIFLIFDVEVVFLFPWALSLNQMPMFVVLEGIIFLGILVSGLVYAWRKGMLEWE